LTRQVVDRNSPRRTGRQPAAGPPLARGLVEDRGKTVITLRSCAHDRPFTYGLFIRQPGSFGMPGREGALRFGGG
jgi:hypothetical protein